MDAGPQIGLAPAPFALTISAAARRGIALTLWALMLLAGLLLAARLAASALETGLPAGGLIGCGLVMLVASAAIRLIWPADVPSHIRPQWVQWGAAVPAAIIALTITIPTWSTVDSIALWLLIAVGETWSIRAFQARWKPPTPRNPPVAIPPRSPHNEPNDTESTSHATELNADDEPLESEVFLSSPRVPSGRGEGPGVRGNPSIVQQLTRVQSPSGEDLIQGLMRARFAAGERTAMLHIAFCPPFAATPQLHVEQLDGPPARIKPGPIQPFGARIEVRLNQPATTATDVLIEFAAEEAVDSPDS